MYSHPYFRKNRPDLLWLIQKPTGKTSTSKRKRDGKDGYDSDDGREWSPPQEGRPQELGAPNAHHEVAQLPRSELAQVRQELQKLQNTQRFISQMISQLKEQNDQFYRQATAFQALHDRHENSINAILTFLATFYNRSLEGHGAQNLVNMFTNVQNQQHQQQGSVVEEYNDGTPTPSNQLQRFIKRPPLLLPGPTSATSNLQPGSATTQPNSARQSVSPPDDSSNRGSVSSAPPESANPKSASVASPAVKTEPPTPQMPENNDEMMNLINSVNATTQASTPNATAPTLDFNSIVDQYQNLNGNNPLTPQQRDNTLANIMRQTGNAGNAVNALTSPGGGMPNFDMNQLKNSRETMEALQNMQKQTADQIQNLSDRLVPLSPSGSIPGLHDVTTDPFDSIGAPGEYDPNAFIDFDGTGWDGGMGAGDEDFDFGFDTSGNDGGGASGNTAWGGGFDAAGGDGSDMFNTSPADGGKLAPNQGNDSGGRVESVSSEATSPAPTVQEVGEDIPGTPNKRQRRS
jgi:heat shock transcription factor